MKIFYKKYEPLVNNFIELIEKIESSETKNFTRSTIPFLIYWRNFSEKLISLSENLDFSYISEIDLFFEYPTKSYRELGKSGKPSFTDMMIISAFYSIAIEAKYTEPRYEVCNEWVKKGKDIDFRKNVILHWIKIINDFAGSNVKFDDFNDVPYQVLHRTASGCSLNKSQCFINYQIFYEEKKKDFYFQDLSKIKSLVNSSKLKFSIQWVKLNKNPKFEEISTNLNESKNKPYFIKNQIINNDLYNFSNEEFIKI